mgnify:CR=1 FL=1
MKMEEISMNVKQSTRKLVTLGMLGALSIVLVFFIHFPLLPAAPWMEYDPADIPILIGTFLYGPWAGLALTVVVSVIQGLTVSAQSGIIGIVMHLLATGAFVLVAGGIYQRHKTIGWAVVSLICGVVAMTIVMVGCNLVFTPIFLGQAMGDVVAMLLPVIIPFNLLKAGINGIVTFVVYKPIGNILRIEPQVKGVQNNA